MGIEEYINNCKIRTHHFNVMLNNVIKSVNPFDLLSGKVVINEDGIFWFKEPGNNIDKDGYLIRENASREDNKPCIIYYDGRIIYQNENVLIVNYDYVSDVFNRPVDKAREIYKLIPE